ncbi:MAG TPA: putative lipid II flippase FtsW [Acidobacteriota bacterium]|nr:putative lipid II flippase FtsW [Acidobacteriota bacterium]
MAKKLGSDRLLFTTTIALMMFGLVMIYSASAVLAMEKYGNPFYYAIRQGIWCAISLCGLLVMMNVHYRTWNQRVLAYTMLAIVAALLVAVLFMAPIANVRRWFRAGPASLQPAELAKFPLVVFLAYHLSRRQGQIETLWPGILPALLVSGQLALLVVLEPDLGTAVMYIGVTVALLFLAGMPWRYFAASAAVALPMFYFLIMNVDYRRERLLVFLNPEANAQEGGFQILQSLIALGTGGVQGVGLANSIQKLFYLPEPHTDFIYAIIGEELGLIGCVAVVLAFVFFLWRGLRIAWKAPDPFAQFLAAGITIMIVLQAFINISVVIGLMPTKGIPLPFISSGGSSLLVSMMGVGVLLNISQHV